MSVLNSSGVWCMFIGGTVLLFCPEEPEHIHTTNTGKFSAVNTPIYLAHVCLWPVHGDLELNCVVGVCMYRVASGITPTSSSHIHTRNTIYVLVTTLTAEVGIAPSSRRRDCRIHPQRKRKTTRRQLNGQEMAVISKLHRPIDFVHLTANT